MQLWRFVTSFGLVQVHHTVLTGVQSRGQEMRAKLLLWQQKYDAKKCGLVDSTISMPTLLPSFEPTKQTARTKRKPIFYHLNYEENQCTRVRPTEKRQHSPSTVHSRASSTPSRRDVFEQKHKSSRQPG